MSVFLNASIANEYDNYYQTAQGKRIDLIEKKIVSELLQTIQERKRKDANAENPDEMLELGCGTGHWTEFFVSQGFRVTGVDLSEPMLNLARSKNLWANLQIADSENLPFENERFDVLATITMLEFVNDPGKVVQEANRVLKNDGYLLIGFLNAESVVGKNKNLDETFKDARFYTAHEIGKLFAGFRHLQTKSGVYLSENYQIIDDTDQLGGISPVFIAAIFQKTCS